MDQLQKPFFIAALLFFALVALIEVGSPLATGGTNSLARVQGMVDSIPDVDADDVTITEASEPPGRGIIAMAMVDLVLLFRIGVMGLALVVPARLLGRLQGIVTLILSLLAILAGILILIFLIVELIVMVSLFLAAPFGTIAYLVIWGLFPRGDAAALLSLLLLLKLGGVVFLLLSQHRFLRIKSLMLLIATSLVMNLVLAFLHGIAPNPITSIADQIGAIIFVILGLIWLLLTLIGSIWGVVSVLRVDRSLSH